MNIFYYADSSALVKRHIPEIGSAWIEQEFDAVSGNRVIYRKINCRRSFKRNESPPTRSKYFRDGIYQFFQRLFRLCAKRLQNL